jgi:hypothetical protein
MSDWEVSFNGGIYDTEEPPNLLRKEVVARNSRTGQSYVGTPEGFEYLLRDLPYDTGIVSKTGAGVITTTVNVALCRYHRILNTHGTAALTVDVSYDDGANWTIGVTATLDTGSPGATVAAGASAILEGKFDRVRLVHAEAAGAGRITSFTTAQW